MKTTTLPEMVQGEIYYQRLAAAPERDSEVNKVHAVVEILKAAGWRDTCDAQWEGIEAALPDLRAVLAAELVRDAERYRWLRTYNTAKHPAVAEAFFLGDENLDAEIDAAIVDVKEY